MTAAEDPGGQQPFRLCQRDRKRLLTVSQVDHDTVIQALQIADFLYQEGDSLPPRWNRTAWAPCFSSARPKAASSRSRLTGLSR